MTAGKGMAPEVILEAVNVHKHFGSFTALKGINLEVRRGEVVCILGPSGSGKSTFLRCINQLEGIDEGAMWMGGELVGYKKEGNHLRAVTSSQQARQRQAIGMVFQRFNLFPHMTALENIIEGPVGVLGHSRKSSVETAKKLLSRVGLGTKGSSYPNALSGGEQQRVAIARSLAMSPELMLFDEPTSALDPELVGEVLAVIKGLAAEGMTMVVVTHEIAFAREVADTILFLDEGEVVDCGPADAVINNPSNERTKAFFSAVLK